MDIIIFPHHFLKPRVPKLELERCRMRGFIGRVRGERVEEVGVVDEWGYQENKG